jgi:hypothetical protein
LFDAEFGLRRAGARLLLILSRWMWEKFKRGIPSLVSGDSMTIANLGDLKIYYEIQGSGEPVSLAPAS